jgi:uncharacterized protein YdhG (YjbR/CyaY superfamily)
MEGKAPPSTVDEYITQFPEEIQQIMTRIRAVIKEAAPQSEERISYQMPGYFQNGQLVWFGGHKNHIGFYPTGSGVEAFKEDLLPYRISKGSIQFPLDEAIPYELIARIVKFKVAENLAKKSKAKK